LTSFVEHAGCWFLHSGIQAASGGVARYYQADSETYRAVSSEITGYAASALLYFHARTGHAGFLDGGLRAARFLAHEAWDGNGSVYPFEPGSDRAYFFDTGIIARGLLAAWRASGEAVFLERARQAALSLAFDFLGEGCFYPVIALPEKQPLPEEPRWSRRPGCYQLKAALVWRDLDDPHAARMFETALAHALAGHERFLDGEPESLMDRLHAYCYFLEALLFAGERREARAALESGLARAADLLRRHAPEFERSDVNAQLLRVRLIAHHLDLLALDEEAAHQEAERAASYFAGGGDPRVRGGFWFGAKHGRILPFSNPVSTAFCAQALALWQDHREGRWSFDPAQLI
jgi:hypothetical protein